MTWLTGIILYILVWWTTLFAVLPWGIRHEASPDPARHSPGAPVNPQIGRKFIITTILAAFIWSGVFILVKTNIIDFRAQSIAMMEKDKVK